MSGFIYRIAFSFEPEYTDLPTCPINWNRLLGRDEDGNDVSRYEIRIVRDFSVEPPVKKDAD